MNHKIKVTKTFVSSMETQKQQYETKKNQLLLEIMNEINKHVFQNKKILKKS
tara:strand:+ start:603 stop:758 length:156 start_codon:yes stop_codon:yes gene_type:complete